MPVPAHFLNTSAYVPFILYTHVIIPSLQVCATGCQPVALRTFNKHGFLRCFEAGVCCVDIGRIDLQQICSRIIYKNGVQDASVTQAFVNCMLKILIEKIKKDTAV